MKILLKTMLVFIMVAVAVSCSDEEAAVVPVKEDNIKTDTKISIEQARQDLLGLLSDLDSERSRSYDKLPRTIKNVQSFKLKVNDSRSEEAPDIYVFNFDKNQGYAIMSGDERIPSLIALADSGSINENDTIDNPGFGLFLDNMIETYAVDFKPADDSIPSFNWGDTQYTINGKWENTVYKVNGYCPVKWSQKYPYNKLCPTIDDKYTLTGCPTVALAQLMAVYKYPSYYNSYSFNWDNMISNNADISIARLMEQLGLKQNLDAEYGLSETPVDYKNVRRTLNNFGYSNSGAIKDYNTDGIVSELQNGHVVLCHGFSHKEVTKFLGITVKTHYSGGHTWLMHGLLKRSRTISTYDLETRNLINTKIETFWYPLCNWGWSGTNDGYYLSGVFDTNKGSTFKDDTPSSRSQSEYNYQFDLKMIIGIRK